MENEQNNGCLVALTEEQQKRLVEAGWKQHGWGHDYSRGSTIGHECWAHADLPISFWVDTTGAFTLTPAAAHLLKEAAAIVGRPVPADVSLFLEHELVDARKRINALEEQVQQITSPSWQKGQRLRIKDAVTDEDLRFIGLSDDRLRTDLRHGFSFDAMDDNPLFILDVLGREGKYGLAVRLPSKWVEPVGELNKEENSNG